MSDCTISLAPGQAIAPHLAEGAVICLQAGVYAERLELTSSVTLRGEPGAILDGGSGGPVVHVGADRLQIAIEGVTIRNGAHAFGSGVCVEGYSMIALRHCAFTGNTRGEGGGAGLGARRGFVEVEDCTFAADDDVIFTKTAEANVVRTTVEGDLAVLEKAKVRLEGGAVRGKLTLRGTTTSAPVLTIAGAEIANLVNHDEVPGEIVRE